MASAEPLEPDPGHAGEGTETLAFSRISSVIFGVSEDGRSYAIVSKTALRPVVATRSHRCLVPARAGLPAPHVTRMEAV